MDTYSRGIIHGLSLALAIIKNEGYDNPETAIRMLQAQLKSLQDS